MAADNYTFKKIKAFKTSNYKSNYNIQSNYLFSSSLADIFFKINSDKITCSHFSIISESTGQLPPNGLFRIIH